MIFTFFFKSLLLKSCRLSLELLGVLHKSDSSSDWQNGDVTKCEKKNTKNKLHNSKGRSLASQSGHTPRCGLYTEDLSEQDTNHVVTLRVDMTDMGRRCQKGSSLDEQRLTWSHTRIVWFSRVQPFVIFCRLTAADGHSGLSFWVCGKLSLLMLQTPETVFGLRWLAVMPVPTWKRTKAKVCEAEVMRKMS